MNPKKVKNMLPDFAIENKEDLVLLQKLHNFYWNKVRETLSCSPHTRVKVINFGTFTRKSWNVDKMLTKKTALLNSINDSSRSTIKANLEAEIKHLLEIKDFQNQEKEQQAKIKTKRDEYNKTLEKSKPDLGRS